MGHVILHAHGLTILHWKQQQPPTCNSLISDESFQFVFPLIQGDLQTSLQTVHEDYFILQIHSPYTNNDTSLQLDTILSLKCQIVLNITITNEQQR